MGSPAVVITPDQPVTITPDAQPDHSGMWHALGSDLLQMAKSAPSLLPPVALYHQIRHAVDNYKSLQETGGLLKGKTLEQRAAEGREQAGYSSLYSRVGAPLGEALGVNVSGMEDSATQGDVGGVIGHAVAVPAAMALTEGAVRGVPAVANKVSAGAQSAARGLYQRALKPSVASYSPAEAANLVKTGLEEKIPISEGGMQKIDSLVRDLGDKVKQEISRGAQAGMTIDPQKVASRVDQARARFQTQANPKADLEAIQASKQEFLDTQPNPIPVDKAQALKQGTNTVIRKSYGELKGATIEAQKALVRGIKEELEVHFPEIKGLNARDGRLIQLDHALETAVRRIGNHNLISLGGKAVTTGAGVVAGMETGHALVGATAGLVMHEVMSSPMLQSRLAIALNTAGKGRFSVGASNARVMSYVGALAASAQGNAGQASQATQTPDSP